jgi:hypothetical protein
MLIPREPLRAGERSQALSRKDEIMSAKTYTLAALVVYVILGAIDFIDTYALIQRGDGTVYESNPLANDWLKDYGWKGLAVFKILITTVLVTTVLVIRRHRPQTAAVLATVACVTLLAVTLYSRRLLTAT